MSLGASDHRHVHFPSTFIPLQRPDQKFIPADVRAHLSTQQLSSYDKIFQRFLTEGSRPSLPDIDSTFTPVSAMSAVLHPEEVSIMVKANRPGALAPQASLDDFTQLPTDATITFDYTTARGSQKSITGLTPAFVRPSERHAGKSILVGFAPQEDGTFTRKTFRADRIENLVKDSSN